MVLLRSWSVRGFIVIVLGLLGGVHARGQLIATLDLTQTPPPTEPVADKTAPGKEGIECHTMGMMATLDRSQEPKSLTVSIITVKPKTAGDKENYVATLRLKNEGKDTIFIPWLRVPVTPVPVETTTPVEAGTEEYSYETASLGMQLRAGNAQMFLRGDATFWANPKIAQGHEAIWRGEWVDILMPFTVHCEPERSGTVCTKYLAGGPVQLLASWYEQSRSDEYKKGECTEVSFTTRSITSEVTKMYHEGVQGHAGTQGEGTPAPGKTR